MIKKILFWLVLALVVLGSVSNLIFPIQILPFSILVVLMALKIWGKKNTVLGIVTLSILMVLLNIVVESWVDVVLWAGIGLAFYEE